MVRSKVPGRPRGTAPVSSRAAIWSSVRIGTGFSGADGISMPSVGATSSSPSATSHRQKCRIPRSRVPTVEAPKRRPARPARRRSHAGSVRRAPARGRDRSSG
jgi:hypothetical protein